LLEQIFSVHDPNLTPEQILRLQFVRLGAASYFLEKHMAIPASLAQYIGREALGNYVTELSGDELEKFVAGIVTHRQTLLCVNHAICSEEMSDAKLIQFGKKMATFSGDVSCKSFFACCKDLSPDQMRRFEFVLLGLIQFGIDDSKLFDQFASIVSTFGLNELTRIFRMCSQSLSEDQTLKFNSICVKAVVQLFDRFDDDNKLAQFWDEMASIDPNVLSQILFACNDLTEEQKRKLQRVCHGVAIVLIRDISNDNLMQFGNEMAASNLYLAEQIFSAPDGDLTPEARLRLQFVRLGAASYFFDKHVEIPDSLAQYIGPKALKNYVTQLSDGLLDEFVASIELHRPTMFYVRDAISEAWIDYVIELHDDLLETFVARAIHHRSLLPAKYEIFRKISSEQLKQFGAKIAKVNANLLNQVISVLGEGLTGDQMQKFQLVCHEVAIVLIRDISNDNLMQFGNEIAASNLHLAEQIFFVSDRNLTSEEMLRLQIVRLGAASYFLKTHKRIPESFAQYIGPKALINYVTRLDDDLLKAFVERIVIQPSILLYVKHSICSVEISDAELIKFGSKIAKVPDSLEQIFSNSLEQIFSVNDLNLLEYQLRRFEFVLVGLIQSGIDDHDLFDRLVSIVRRFGWHQSNRIFHMCRQNLSADQMLKFEELIFPKVVVQLIQSGILEYNLAQFGNGMASIDPNVLSRILSACDKDLTDDQKRKLQHVCLGSVMKLLQSDISNDNLMQFVDKIASIASFDPNLLENALKIIRDQQSGQNEALKFEFVKLRLANYFYKNDISIPPNILSYIGPEALKTSIMGSQSNIPNDNLIQFIDANMANLNPILLKEIFGLIDQKNPDEMRRFESVRLEVANYFCKDGTDIPDILVEYISPRALITSVAQLPGDMLPRFVTNILDRRLLEQIISTENQVSENQRHISQGIAECLLESDTRVENGIYKLKSISEKIAQRVLQHDDNQVVEDGRIISRWGCSVEEFYQMFPSVRVSTDDEEQRLKSIYHGYIQGRIESAESDVELRQLGAEIAKLPLYLSEQLFCLETDDHAKQQFIRWGAAGSFYLQHHSSSQIIKQIMSGDLFHNLEFGMLKEEYNWFREHPYQMCETEKLKKIIDRINTAHHRDPKKLSIIREIIEYMNLIQAAIVVEFVETTPEEIIAAPSRIKNKLTQVQMFAGKLKDEVQIIQNRLNDQDQPIPADLRWATQVRRAMLKLATTFQNHDAETAFIEELRATNGIRQNIGVVGIDKVMNRYRTLGKDLAKMVTDEEFPITVINYAIKYLDKLAKFSDDFSQRTIYECILQQLSIGIYEYVIKERGKIPYDWQYACDCGRLARYSKLGNKFEHIRCEHYYLIVQRLKLHKDNLRKFTFILTSLLNSMPQCARNSLMRELHKPENNWFTELENSNQALKNAVTRALEQPDPHHEPQDPQIELNR